MKNLSFEQRQLGYERDKAKLMSKPLTDIEYQREIKKLADKWRI